MRYASVSARFKFFNGKNGYTVEYTYGIRKWYIFNDDEDTNAIYSKVDKTIKNKNINNDSAEDILYEFLNKESSQETHPYKEIV